MFDPLPLSIIIFIISIVYAFYAIGDKQLAQCNKCKRKMTYYELGNSILKYHKDICEQCHQNEVNQSSI